MDPVMLAEVIDVHGNVRFQHRRTGAGQDCRIGRSLNCDIVLDDAYAAPEHTLLSLQADGRVHVRDLGTLNGTRLDGRKIDPERGATVQAAELLVGRTRIRVRASAAELPPERLFRRDLLRRHRTALATSGLALCIAFAAFLQWREAPERLGPPMLIAVLITCGGLGLWVLAWSLVSRLTHGQWRIRVHLAIASVTVAMCAWGYWLCSLGAFALQWRWLVVPAGILAASLVLGMAYLHLRFATGYRRSFAFGLALLAPLVAGGILWLVELQRDPQTVNRVDPGPDVFPSSLRLAPSVDLADYLTDVAALKREARDNRQHSLLEMPLADMDE